MFFRISQDGLSFLGQVHFRASADRFRADGEGRLRTLLSLGDDGSDDGRLRAFQNNRTSQFSLPGTCTRALEFVHACSFITIYALVAAFSGRLVLFFRRLRLCLVMAPQRAVEFHERKVLCLLFIMIHLI